MNLENGIEQSSIPAIGEQPQRLNKLCVLCLKKGVNTPLIIGQNTLRSRVKASKFWCNECSNEYQRIERAKAKEKKLLLEEPKTIIHEENTADVVLSNKTERTPTVLDNDLSSELTKWYNAYEQSKLSTEAFKTVYDVKSEKLKQHQKEMRKIHLGQYNEFKKRWLKVQDDATEVDEWEMVSRVFYVEPKIIEPMKGFEAVVMGKYLKDYYKSDEGLLEWKQRVKCMLVTARAHGKRIHPSRVNYDGKERSMYHVTENKEHFDGQIDYMEECQDKLGTAKELREIEKQIALKEKEDEARKQTQLETPVNIVVKSEEGGMTQ